MPANVSVEDFLHALDHPAKPLLLALRALVRSAAPQLDEWIKWNGPSFHIDGDDRVTLGFQRSGACGWCCIARPGRGTPPGSSSPTMRSSRPGPRRIAE